MKGAARRLPTAVQRGAARPGPERVIYLRRTRVMSVIAECCVSVVPSHRVLANEAMMAFGPVEGQQQ